jgi:hypothetical protein
MCLAGRTDKSDSLDVVNKVVAIGAPGLQYHGKSPSVFVLLKPQVGYLSLSCLNGTRLG